MRFLFNFFTVSRYCFLPPRLTLIWSTDIKECERDPRKHRSRPGQRSRSLFHSTNVRFCAPSFVSRKLEGREDEQAVASRMEAAHTTHK